MSEFFLSMHGVSKRYTGVQALASVDFDIRYGEVHCLTGENGSGKSTLIKIISGVVQPEPGAHIEIDGDTLSGFSSIDSIRHGVEVIYQDLSLFPNMTVAENIAIGQLTAEKKRFVQTVDERVIAEKAMKRIGVKLPLEETVGDLSMGDQQLVAICRALTSNVRLLIMDEPTTALTRTEVAGLFRVVEGLRSQGISALFISHKLDEVFEIAERVTVLRDGKKIGTYPASELDSDKLTFLMTGTNVNYTPYRNEYTDDERLRPVLEVSGLTKRNNYADVSFSLFPGDVLGITGLLGSGRTELALSLFGMNPSDSGTVYLNGEEYPAKTTPRAVAAGVAYVPENRLIQGLVMPQSVAKNVVMSTIRRILGRFGLIDRERMDEEVAKWISDLGVKVPSPESAVRTLSGGNQQKVVLAKWISTNPRVLILDGPTVGIDVAAKSAIHQIIRSLAERGIGIIIISDEVEEVYGNCNRILVMHRGRIVREFDVSQTTTAEIAATVES